MDGLLSDADERVKPMMEFARSIGCGNGKFVKLAFDIDEYLSNTRLKYKINIAAVCAALLADEGISANGFLSYGDIGFYRWRYALFYRCK